VHHNIVIGKDVFMGIDVAGHGNAKFIRHGLGSAGVADPLNQRQTVGFKIDAIGYKVIRSEGVYDYQCIPTFAQYNTNVHRVNGAPAAADRAIPLTTAQLAEAATLGRAIKFDHKHNVGMSDASLDGEGYYATSGGLGDGDDTA
jgi:hypothetical protein